MSNTHPTGLYEELVTEAIDADLDRVAESAPFTPLRANLARPEAGDRLALHLARLIQTTIESLPHKERVSSGLALSRWHLPPQEIWRHGIARTGVENTRRSQQLRRYSTLPV